MKQSLVLFIFILGAWTVFRWLVPTEAVTDEFVVKPLLFIVPTIYLLYREKQPLSFLGISSIKLLNAILWGCAAGIFLIGYSILINTFKGQVPHLQLHTNWALGAATALATAISEEIVFRGYILNKIRQTTQSIWLAVGVSTIFFVIVHLPRSILVLHLTWSAIAVYCVLLTFLGAINGLLMWKTKNIAASLTTHTLWNAYLAITG